MWVSLIFHSYSRHVLKLLTPALITIGLYTFGLTWLVVDYFGFEFKSTTAVHSILGIVLGLFLVFRMNTAYDRWWEGRQMWGTLINASRNLAMKINSFTDKDDTEVREFFVKMIPNFAYALKEHLRDGVKFEELDFTSSQVENTIRNSKNVPSKVVAIMYDQIRELLDKSKITGQQLLIIDYEMKELQDIQGSCERIKNTPIPYNYSMYLKKFIFTYTITLPFGFVTEFFYWTIPIVLLLFFTLLSIELIAEEIEDPFGSDINDLPTNVMSETIRNNVEELIELNVRQPAMTIESKELS